MLLARNHGVHMMGTYLLLLSVHLPAKLFDLVLMACLESIVSSGAQISKMGPETRREIGGRAMQLKKAALVTQYGNTSRARHMHVTHRQLHVAGHARTCLR